MEQEGVRQGDKRGKLEVLVVAQEGVRRHMVRVKAVGGGGAGVGGGGNTLEQGPEGSGDTWKVLGCW